MIVISFNQILQSSKNDAELETSAFSGANNIIEVHSHCALGKTSPRSVMQTFAF